MSNSSIKHDFVDDYPYIAYAPKADTAVTENESSLPIASADTLGGVKVGNGLSITEEGVLSASGSGGGVFLIESEVVQNVLTLKKTWKEIKDAYISGKQCIITLIIDAEDMYVESYSIVTTVNNTNDETYSVHTSQVNTSTFASNSENGYPILNTNG